MDTQFTVNLSLQTIQEYGHWAYCAFIELVKACDTALTFDRFQTQKVKIKQEDNLQASNVKKTMRTIHFLL